MKQTLAIGFIFLSAPILFSKSDDNEKKKPGSVRILNAADELPARYQRRSDGGISPIMATDEEQAPSLFYIKESGNYTPFLAPRNGISTPTSLVSGKKADGGYYIQLPPSPNNIANGSGEKTSASANEGKTPEKKIDWALISQSPPDDGHDYLLCLYQPSTKSKWFAPKKLLVDISPDSLAPRETMVINLSDRPIYVQLGAGTKPVTIAPNEKVRAPAPSGDAPGLIRVAAVGKTKAEVVFNMEKSIPAGERAVLFAYTAYPQNTHKPVFVRHTTFAEPGSTQDKPKK